MRPDLTPFTAALTRRRLKAAVYIPVLGLAMALTMVRVLVYARTLSTHEFAELNLVLIISTLFTTFVSFGLFSDLQRKMPIDLQRQDVALAVGRLLLAIAGTFAVALAGIPLLLAAAALGSVASVVGLTGILHGLSQQLFLVTTTESRSARETSRYSIQSLVRAILIIGLAVPVAMTTGSAVMALATEALLNLAASGLILARITSQYTIGRQEILRQLSDLWRRTSTSDMAFLVMISFVVAASSNFDRWLAAKLLPTTEFAHYSFAAIITMVAYSTQALINAAIYPAISARFAISVQSALRMSAKSSCLMLACGLFACVPGIPLANWIIVKYFPNYLDATPLITVMAISGTFRLANFWTGFLIIAEKQRLALFTNLAAVLLPLAVWSLVSTLSAASIAYLALTVSVCSFVFSMLGTFYVKRNPHID